jgi:hypothetical protein
MQNDLLKFDAFGMVRIDRSNITTSITAVTLDGKYINRMITEEIDEITDVKPGTSASFLFGAVLDGGKKARLAIRPLANVEDDVETQPQVVKAIERALDFIKARSK